MGLKGPGMPIPGQNCAVEQVVLRWWYMSGLQGNTSSQQPGSWHWCWACLPLNYLALLLWVVLLPVHITLLCPGALPTTSYCAPPSFSALPCSTAWIVCLVRRPWASWLSSSWMPSPASMTTFLLGLALLSLPPDSPGSSFRTVPTSWPLAVSVPTAGCPRWGRGMCLFLLVWFS